MASEKRIDVNCCHPRINEVVAGTALSPGTAINMAADGEFDHCSVTAAEYLKGALCIAMESASGIGQTISDTVVAGDSARALYPKPGDTVLVLCKSGEDLAVGDKLIPEQTSGLFVEAAGSEARYLLEVVEAEGVLAANTFVKARVLS